MTRFIHEPLEVQFWSKVDKRGPDECWEWQAAKYFNGYGMLRVERRLTRAHRISYEFVYGLIPAGLHIDHLCNNPGCVNPAHLEAVTQAENNRRMTARGRHWNKRKTHCPSGHAYTEDNIDWDHNGSRHCKKCRQTRDRDR